MTIRNNSQIPVRVRMAPSPTGRLHIGTARTALFNFLFSRHHEGTFLLRIEDTDKERSKPEFEREIVSYLKWLGISWDGEIIRQSERIATYKPFLEELLESGMAFYCFHSDEELDAKRMKAEAAGGAFLLRSDYRNLSPADAQKLIAEGREYVIRFKVPVTGNEPISFVDLIRGKTSFNANVVEDFAIAKKLDEPLYNFTVVIDDHLMAISHVIRGEDHISNTPKQLLLYAAMGWQPPQFAHLPLILGVDRSKLSKRHGATSVVEFEEQGYLPEALANFMALLGWNPGKGEEREIYTLEELTKIFSIGNVQRSGAVFNQEKLDWMNAAYIRKLSDAELLERVRSFWKIDLSKFDHTKVLAIIALTKERMKKLSDIVELSELFFKAPEYDKALLQWKDMGEEEIPKSLKGTKDILELISSEDFTAARLNEVLRGFTADMPKKGVIFWPLRVALTGREASPPPAPVMEILGKEESMKRIYAAIGLFS